MTNWTKTLIIAWAVAIGIGQAEAKETAEKLKSDFDCVASYFNLDEGATAHDYAKAMIETKHDVLKAVFESCSGEQFEPSFITRLQVDAKVHGLSAPDQSFMDFRHAHFTNLDRHFK